MIEEREILARGPITIADYEQLRHRIIFVEEYIWTWLLSERMPVDAVGLAVTKRLRRLASEIVYLVNDVGSVERERKKGGHDPNLFFLLEREHGLALKEAMVQVIERHNRTVCAYRNEVAALSASPSPGTYCIVEVLERVVAGNLATTKRLAESRYPGSFDALQRLKFSTSC